MQHQDFNFGLSYIDMKHLLNKFIQIFHEVLKSELICEKSLVKNNQNIVLK